MKREAWTFRNLPKPTLGDWIGGIALCAIFVELMFLPLIFG